MSQRKNKQWLLVERPSGMIEAENFEWSEKRLGPIYQGQVLVRTIYLSLDPTNRNWMSADTYMPKVPLGEVMRGLGIGIVEESRNSDFEEGDLVEGITGWQEYLVSDGSTLRKVERYEGVPMATHFALLSHIGLTAYVGLLEIGNPKVGEQLVVSAASGAVGSLVGQIGKIKGCRVVGITGGEKKCRYIVDQLGFDEAVDYKGEDLEESLAKACSEGIDIDFENVGGQLMDSVLGLMNQNGRVVLCGLISEYNSEDPVPGPYNFPRILLKRLTVQGFIVMDHTDLASRASEELAEWYREGKIHVETEIVNGLENAVAAVNRLFEGDKIGKLLVKVSEAGSV